MWWLHLHIVTWHLALASQVPVLLPCVVALMKQAAFDAALSELRPSVNALSSIIPTYVFTSPAVYENSLLLVLFLLQTAFSCSKYGFHGFQIKNREI